MGPPGLEPGTSGLGAQFAGASFQAFSETAPQFLSMASVGVHGFRALPYDSRTLPPYPRTAPLIRVPLGLEQTRLMCEQRIAHPPFKGQVAPGLDTVAARRASGRDHLERVNLSS